MEQLSHEQALDVVKVMIQKTKESRCYSGFYHLLWGIIVSIAIIVMYIFIKMEMYNWIGISWAVFGFGGAIISIIHNKRNNDKKGFIQYPDLGINAMWTGLMISMFLVCFAYPILKAYDWRIVIVMVSLLLGSANFSTGIFLKEKWPLINGITWWIGSIVLLLLHDYFTIMGTFVLLLIINNIIPGIFLYIQARKINGK